MVSLDQHQRDVLSAITENGTKNYWAGYTYVKNAIAEQEGSDDLVYWLDKAAQININDSQSEANIFIRGVTVAGLLYTDASNIDVQANSDLIGASVIGDFLDSTGASPSLQSIILDDINTAITTGGQTIGGWGGAFYYWNFVIDAETGKTVGEEILNDRLEYDKFISVNAMAVSESMDKFGITAEQVLSTLNAQLPTNVLGEILVRVSDVRIEGLSSFAGDPDFIDGYHVAYGENDEVIGWTYNTSEEFGVWVEDLELIAQLNARHAERVRVGADAEFNAGNPDPGLASGGGLAAIENDTAELLSIEGESAASYVATSKAQQTLAVLSAWYADRFAMTEGAGTIGGGTSSGILGWRDSSVLEVDFSDEVMNIINYGLENSLGQSTYLSEQARLEPKRLAVDLLAGALAPSDKPNQDMSGVLERSILAVWQTDDTEPLDFAAASLGYFAFEAENGQVANLTAKAGLSGGVASALVGGNASDVLIGLDANDILIGRGGGDNLTGGEGSDILFGGAGDDTLAGGEGDDLLSGGRDSDIMDGGEGWDAASYEDSSEGVSIDLSQEVQQGGDAEGDTFVDIEEIRGSNFGDTLKGDRFFNKLTGGGGDDYLYTAPEHANLNDDGSIIYDPDNSNLENGLYFGGQDILDGGTGFDNYIINPPTEYYAVLVGGPGEVELKQVPLPNTTIVYDEDGLGRLVYNGYDLSGIGQTLKADWRTSSKLPVTAEMVGTDLHIYLPVSTVLDYGDPEIFHQKPLDEWPYSSFYQDDVPDEFDGVGPGTIVVKNYHDGDLGFYFDGGLQARLDAPAALSFDPPTDPYGKAYDNLDGTADFNANLEDVTFSFDGRDLWVLIEGSESNPIHIRGAFDGGSYVRPGATTLDEFNFLDGTLEVADIAVIVAADRTATIGTSGNDVLLGRDGESDYFNGGLGADTYVITADSGSDLIRRDGSTQTQRDTIAFDYASDRVFQRYGPVPSKWLTDQVVEFIDETIDAFGNTRLYLSEQTLTIEDRLYDPVAESYLYDLVEKFDYTFNDTSEVSTNVASLKVYEIAGTRAEFTIQRSTGGEAGYDDLIISNGTITYTIRDQFLEALDDERPTFEDIDLVVFSDREVLTREMLAAAAPVVLSAYDPVLLSGDDPRVVGSRYSETFVGSEAADFIDAGLGDDIIDAGAGDDIIVGDNSITDWEPVDGSDTYIYHAGDGNDIIVDQEIDGSGIDTLKLIDIDSEDIILARFSTPTGFGADEDSNLLVIERSTGRYIEVVNQFISGTSGVEFIEFADNVIMDRADILDAVTDGQPGYNFAPLTRADDLSNYWDYDVMSVNASNLLANDVDIEDSSLTLVSVQDAVGGTVSLEDGVVTFVRDLEFAGIGSFAYTVSDGDKETTQTITFKLAEFVEYEEGDIVGTAGDDVLTGTTDEDAIWGLDGNDHLIGLDSYDYIVGGDGDDVLEGGGGDDDLDGRGGVDWSEYVNSSEGVTVDLAGAILVHKDDLTAEQLEAVFGENIPSYEFSLAVYVADATPEQLATHDPFGIGTGGEADYDYLYEIENLRGSSFDDTFIGDGVSNHLSGEAGDDVLEGKGGGDTLDGGAGVDTMRGGAGNDIYIVDDVGDIVDESGDGSSGTDSVQSSVSFSLANAVQALGALENLTLTGTGAINATGNVLDNVIIGNAGNNTINGGAGADTMHGGAGDDIFYVDNAGDQVVELAGQGIDTVRTGYTHTLAANVENLDLLYTGNAWGTGNALNNRITGNAGNNTLNGMAGNDTIDGGSGADTMYGGEGNDIYLVDNAGDQVVELAGQGVDTVRAAGTHTLAANVENLELLYTGNAYGTGNGLDNRITGNVSNNVLNGMAGNDLLEGMAGNDTIDGGLGADTMYGGEGDDIYFVDNAGDQVVELTGQGVDTVRTGFSHTLAANVENLELLYTGNAWGTGNGLDNRITGNAGNNTLNGGAGIDQLFGGDGNDIFVIASSSDSLNEIIDGGAGADRLRFTSATAGQTLVLSSNVTGVETAAIENAAGSASGTTALNIDAAAVGYGMQLVGNAGANILTGTTYSDVLTGNAGDDSFVFVAGFGNDAINDFVAGAGSADVIEVTDDVFADFSAVLAAASQVGADTLITYDVDNTILLKNVAMANLHQDDFRFIAA